MRVVFGSWTPDLDPLVVGPLGLTEAKGVMRTGGGYRPMSIFAPQGFAALNSAVRGAIGSVIDDSGSEFNFAGTGTKLYLVGPSAAVEDVTNTGGDYSVAATENWAFAVFDQDVIAVVPGEEPQVYALGSAGDFADLADGSVPQATKCGVVHQFLVLGDLSADHYSIPGLGANSIQWSAIGNPASWPEPGTDTAVAVQSDYRNLHGPGGKVMAIVSGPETGYIFQEKIIQRMDYVGGDVIFEFTPSIPGRGCMVQNLAIPTPRGILFLDEAGWFMFDGSNSVPVGADKIDRTFLADIDMDYPYKVSWAIDPDSTMVAILYPGAGNSSGVPNKLLLYDWAIDDFTEADITNCEWLSQIRLPASSLTVDGDPDENIDTAGGSYDDPRTGVGRAVMGGYSTSHILGTFSGSPMVGTICTGDIEPHPNRMSFVGTVLPMFQGGPSILAAQASARKLASDDVEYGAYDLPNSAGKFNFRKKGRYHRFRFSTAGLWDSVAGCDVNATPSGRR